MGEDLSKDELIMSSKKEEIEDEISKEDNMSESREKKEEEKEVLLSGKDDDKQDKREDKEKVVDSLAGGGDEEEQRGNFYPEQDIEPLPPPGLNRTDRRSGEATPGAHAVGGRPRSARPLASNQESPTTRRNQEEEDATALAGFLVVEEDAEETEFEEVEAKSLPMRSQTTRPNNNRRLFAMAGYLACIVGLLVVLLAVFLPSSNDTDTDANTNTITTQETQAPTEELTSPMYPPFQDDLRVTTLNAIREGPHTPEYKANAWMWNDPFLEQYSKQRQRKRFGMAALYYATHGENWYQNDHWLDYKVPECLWFSKATQYPVCDTFDQDTLTTLDLHNNNLTGTLPEAFFHTKPRYLDISTNQIHGEFPTWPANSTFIEVFHIYDNIFEGYQKAEAGLRWDNLRVIRIDGNCFVGNCGRVFRFNPQVEIFNSTNNCLNCPVTPQFQFLTNLRYVGQGHAELWGPLATELGLLTNLWGMDYSGNAITGTIPSELNQLTNLVELQLDETELTGSLPTCTLCNRQEEGLLEVSLNCSAMQCGCTQQ